MKWLASRAGTDVEAKKAVNRALVGVRKIMQQTSLRESGATGCFGGGEDLMVALEEAKDAVDAAQLEKLILRPRPGISINRSRCWIHKFSARIMQCGLNCIEKDY